MIQNTPVIGSTVCRLSKSQANGRTGQITELEDKFARVNWTRDANGEAINYFSWVHVDRIKVITDENKAVTAIRRKMATIINQIQAGPLSSEEYDLMMQILGRIKGDGIWSIGINKYMAGPREHDAEFLAGLADQCIDDIFTMTCIVGQVCVIYLLRTVNN